MNHEIKKQIVIAAETFMADHKLSQNDFAKKCGVNAAYLVAMRKGEYFVNAGNDKTVEIADRHFEKIAEFIGISLRKSYWETKPTEQLMEAMAILEDSKTYGYTNTIIGDTGCGKSYALELFAKKHPADVFVITVSQLDNIGDLLDKVVDLLKIVPGKTKSKKLKDIVKKLRDMKLEGFTPMLVFDECEYMKQPALCAMKELYDNLNKYCSIVLVGHYQLITNIEKLRKKSKDGIPQLYRRIKFGIRYLPNIDRKFKPFIEDLEDKQLRRFLSENCENYGELHDVLVPAMREADRTGEFLTESFVRKVLNLR